MRSKLKIRLTAAACAAALLLGACAPGGKKASAPEGGEGQKPAEAVELRMAWWGGDERHQATLEALKVFEEKNPGVTVTPEYQGYDGYHDKIITQLAGGTAPDVFQFNPEDIMTIAGSGHPVDLLAYSGKELDLTNVPENNLKDGTFDGKLLTVPLSLQTFCVLMNQTMFEAAGVALPKDGWSWEDYDALLLELKEKLPSGVYPCNDLRMTADGPNIYVHQQGGALLTPDGQIKFAEYAGPFFEKFQRFMEQGIVPTIEESATGLDQLFTEGRVAMEVNYNAMVSGLAAEMADGSQVALAPIPGSQEDKKLGMWVKGDIGLVVNQKSAHIPEGVRLVSAFINDSDMYKSLKLTRGVPPSSAILEELKADMTPLDKRVVEMQELAAQSLDTPEARCIKGWSTHYKIVTDEVQNYAFGNETLEEALQNIVSRFEKELKDAA